MKDWVDLKIVMMMILRLRRKGKNKLEGEIIRKE